MLAVLHWSLFSRHGKPFLLLICRVDARTQMPSHILTVGLEQGTHREESSGEIERARDPPTS